MTKIIKKILAFLKKNKRLIIGVVSGAFVLTFLLFSSHGLFKWLSLKLQMSSLQSDIREETERQDSLTKKIELLLKDKSEIERIARENYGMIKPGEKVYIIRNNNGDNSEIIRDYSE